MKRHCSGVSMFHNGKRAKPNCLMANWRSPILRMAKSQISPSCYTSSRPRKRPRELVLQFCSSSYAVRVLVNDQNGNDFVIYLMLFGQVRSICKPLKPLGIHSVSLHPGASIEHQISGYVLF